MPKVTIATSVGAGGKNNAADVIVVKKRLIALGFDWLVADEKVGPLTIDTIKLFQGIKNNVDNVKIIKNDGLINVNGDTHRWLEAANAPRWQMMSKGSKAEGYINREVSDLSDNHDFGTNWLDDVLKATGAEYRDTFLKANPTASVIVVNDASRPQGGDTPDHAGHETGLVCDIFLPRKDGESGGITVGSSAYHRAAMEAMIRAFRKHPLADRVFLNDTNLIGKGLCRPATGHGNHAHFEIKTPIIQKDAT